MASLMTIGITGKRIEEFNESKAMCALLWPGETAKRMSNARVTIGSNAGFEDLLREWH